MEKEDPLDEEASGPKDRSAGGATRSREDNWSEEDSLSLARRYLNEVGFRPLLTVQEEVNLSRRSRQGDLTARHRLIEGNLRLVIKVALRYVGRGTPLMDLIEEGNLGLMRAVEGFDAERGIRFSTYAMFWIRQRIEKALFEQRGDVRIPINRARQASLMLRTEQKLIQQLGRKPTLEEVAVELGREAKEVRTIQRYAHQQTSLDQPVATETDRNLADFIEDETSTDPIEFLHRLGVENLLDQWMQELDPQSRTVVQRRFGFAGGDKETLDRIGRSMRLNPEAVRQIQIRALSKLKKLLVRGGFSASALLD
jgi:RNA polymerase nonessential primary-like sigma factor